MIPFRPTFLLLTTFTCLGFALSPASKALLHQPLADALWLADLGTVAGMNSLQVAQFNTTTDRLSLKQGERGPEVSEVQKVLKSLGYYEGEVNGEFALSTETAVAKFQQAAGLEADGEVGPTTWERLEKAQVKPVQKDNSADTKTRQSSGNKSRSKKDWLKLLLIGFGTFSVAAIFAGVFYLLTHQSDREEDVEAENRSDAPSQPLNPSEGASSRRYDDKSGTERPNYQSNGYSEERLRVSDGEVSLPLQPEPVNSPTPTEALTVEQPARLQKIDILDELIAELHSNDPTKRRKAIWELSQRGDSRAVQPLVNLMVDSDSKQRSLILGALSEIGTRTLKPMNRALALSLQDNNPEVRKNAIRDLTRVYDLIFQMSHLLQHASDDSDAEVQETAKWALNQLSRIRTQSGIDNRSGLSHWTSPQENSPEDIP